jgi:hypothetical protein
LLLPQTLRRYKFAIAFENSETDDYVTEKFYQALLAGAVPIVLGPSRTIDAFVRAHWPPLFTAHSPAAPKPKALGVGRWARGG